MVNGPADSSATATTAATGRPAEAPYAVYRPANNATAPTQPASPRLPTTSAEEVDLVKSMTRQQRREYVANFLRTEVSLQSTPRMVAIYLPPSTLIAPHHIFGFRNLPMKVGPTVTDPAVSSWRNRNEMLTMIPIPVVRFVWSSLPTVKTFARRKTSIVHISST
jgi:hypothetical protein